MASMRTIKKNTMRTQSESFSFRYVSSPTGEISGKSVLRQTEDAINAVGKFAKGAYEMSASSDATAKEAKEIANNAQSTASNAEAIANSAIEKVNTLDTVVNGYETKINTAVSTSQAANQTASSANKKSDDAKEIANEANQSASASATSAIEAKNQAESANKEAKKAKEEAEKAKEQAQTALQNAQEASQAAKNSEESANAALNQAVKATEEAYAFRTVGQKLNSGQTIDASLLNPQGNIKVGDSVIDNTGQVYQIVSLGDAEDETVTLSDAIINLMAYVSFNKQTLTTSQKTQARENIDVMADLLRYGIGGGKGTAADAVTLWPSKNLNDINKTGFYTLASDWANTPSGEAAITTTTLMMHIERKFNAGINCMQMFASNGLFVRFGNPSGDGVTRLFTPWKRLAYYDFSEDLKGRSLFLQNDSSVIRTKYKAIKKGEVPAQTTFNYWGIYDSEEGYDNNKNRLGVIQHSISAEGVSKMDMIAQLNDPTQSVYAILSVMIYPDGRVVTRSPTPVDSSNDYNIATTGWSRRNIQTVYLGGRTGSGTSTFTGLVPGRRVVIQVFIDNRDYDPNDSYTFSTTGTSQTEEIKLNPNGITQRTYSYIINAETVTLTVNASGVGSNSIYCWETN